MTHVITIRDIQYIKKVKHTLRGDTFKSLCKCFYGYIATGIYDTIGWTANTKPSIYKQLINCFTGGLNDMKNNTRV